MLTLKRRAKRGTSASASAPWQGLAQDGKRHQKLRRYAVAPGLDALRRRGCRCHVRERRLAEPQVRQLVREREHLCGLSVGAR